MFRVWGLLLASSGAARVETSEEVNTTIDSSVWETLACVEAGKFFPDLAGTGRTVTHSWKGCQARCHAKIGCRRFSFWPDGGCHLQGSDAVWQFSWTGVTGRKVCNSKPYPTHHPSKRQTNDGWSKSGNTRYIPMEMGQRHCTQSLAVTSSYNCQKAATTLGMTWVMDVNREDRPSGCYRNNQNRVYYNRAFVGGSNYGVSAICRRPKHANGYDKRVYNTATCGAGGTKIKTLSKCKSYARKNGLVFAASYDRSDRPSGCLRNVNNKVQFNKYTFQGRASKNHSPVCQRGLRCRCTNDRKAYKCGRSKYPTGMCKSWQRCNKIGDWKFPNTGFGAAGICTY